MESILPSEVARLILGYLEDENWPDLAKIFLETSPLLRECYMVSQRGVKFSRKFHGITLLNLIDKFCAVNALVQERLSKLDGSDAMKTSGDLLDQLRFLMDGSRGQKHFVVNINVPTQNTSQASGGSPIISSSMRKRRHSGPIDRDRSKKVHTSNSPILDGGPEPQVPNCYNTVETTSPEQLPGLKSSDIPVSETAAGPAQEDRRPIDVQCSSTSTEIFPRKDSPGNQEPSHNLSNLSGTIQDIPKAPETSSHTCETGTDTKELMAFTNSEVQTVYGFDNSPELSDSPLENLSLLTKELLNRTELQERIAQTINRTLIPGEAVLRDASFSDNNGDTSIMRELDHAIKSIVSETETDPVFERFLLETIGEGVEGEVSPDEDGAKSPETEGLSSIEVSPEKELEIVEKSPEKPSTDGPTEKIFTVLDDVNAEAILNIINVNNSKENNQETVPTVPTDSTPEPPPVVIQPEMPMNMPEVCLPDNVEPVPSTPAKEDSRTRRKRPARQKRERKAVTPKTMIPEHELVSVPTLVVCSQEEINSMKIPLPRSKSRFVPIMPNGSAVPDPTLYLRTVNVVRSDIKVPPTPSPIRVPEILGVKPVELAIPIQVPIVVPQQEAPLNESITLYGTDSGAEAIVEANMPAVQLEESMGLTGTGLSPFLKLNRKSCSGELSPSADDVKKVDKPDVEESKDEKIVDSQSTTDILTRRTPRSIMKSRSRNHRLSLSTPRRRSTHIRALDFNTPTKGLNTSRRMSDADKSCVFSPKSSKALSKACRTSLFKSPPFAGIPSPKKKTKSPGRLGKIPIATRSPVPKLIGGWDKITGVGMIIDGSSESGFPSPEKSLPVPSSELKKTWDSDLRMAAAGDVVPELAQSKKKVKSVKKRRNSRKEKSPREAISDDEQEGPIAPDITDGKDTSISSPSTHPGKSPDQLKAKKTDSPADEVAKPISVSVEVTKVVTESVIKTSEIVAEGVTKKYAKLKTLTTSVTKAKSRRSLPQTPGGTLEKSSEFGRNDSLKLPVLETPRKFDPDLVPPTPRLLSPNSNMTTPFAQISEDTGNIQTFVSTPEFPPTPSINLTPKQSNDSTIDDKKSEFASRYYQPTCEVKDTKKKCQAEEHVFDSKDLLINSQKYQASTSQLEITQFEVIKENLPKEQAIKELKLSRNSESQLEETDKTGSTLDTVDTSAKDSRTLESSLTAEDTSDSDSDTSSSSSSSTTSCSCSDNTDNTSSKLSTSRRSRKTPHKIECSRTNDLTQESPAIAQNLSAVECKINGSGKSRSSLDSLKDKIESQQQNEKSPLKVIPIAKTEEALEAMDLETPAKDDGLLAEANISETPSSSKAGIETLTNLNTKISAIIKENSKCILQKPLPVVVSVENVLPTIVLKKAMDGECEANKSFMDAKLARELDEKRMRMMSKLKSDNAPRSRACQRNRSKVSADQGKIQPIRKSLRNVERRAQRGLSEPKEPSTVPEIPASRKAQSSRDSSANDDDKLQIVILSENNPVVQLDRLATIPSQEKVPEAQPESSNKPEKDEESNKVKSKVDMVKRDLFSEDEAENQPVKESRLPSAEEVSQSNGSGELPGVLESLDLVPANKSCDEEELEGEKLNHLDISFIYDEAQPSKRLTRRRKMSVSELEFKLQVEDEEGALVWKTLLPTKFEEIFTLTPARKKPIRVSKPKVVKEKAVTCVSKRKGKKVQLMNTECVVSEIKSQPLATSSPVNKDLPAKSEKVKAPVKAKEDRVRSRKRKQSETKEENVEKKARTSDPAALLNGLDIDKLLNKVHGSGS